MRTNWRDFSIGMASGIALCFVLYFAWTMLRPQRSEALNGLAGGSNAPVTMDENALVAANAERSNANAMNPPPELRPAPPPAVVAPSEPQILPVVEEPVPPVVRPRPRPAPPPEEDFGPDDDYGGKPDY